MSAYLELAAARRKRELAEQLSINTMAGRGKPQAIKKQIKELQKE